MRYKEVKEFSNPEYIKRLAEVESSGDPNAESKTSSATGLYQFIEKTWNSLVDKYDLGYSLEDRKDPKKARKVLKLLTDENERYLEKKLGRKPTHAELYLAHFGGMGRAGKVLTSNPDQNIREILPEDYVSSNPGVFKNNNIKTVRDFYNWSAKKFGSPLMESDKATYATDEKGQVVNVNPNLATEEETKNSDFVKQKFYEDPQVIIADEPEEPIFETEEAQESDKNIRKTQAALKIREFFQQPKTQQQEVQQPQPDLDSAYNYIDIETY